MVPADSDRISPVPPYSGCPARARAVRLQGFHLLWRAFPVRFDLSTDSLCGPYYPRPRHCRGRVWAVPRSLATTGGITGLFSAPPPTKMFQFGGLASSRRKISRPKPGWVAPFGYLRIPASLRLPAAFRSLSRPSSPDDTKASTVRPFLLSLI